MSTPASGGSPNVQPQSDAHSSGQSVPRKPSRLRRWMPRLAAAFGALLLFGAIGLGGAEYYTSRPTFCGTCHVMDPYYESWSHDIHGAKVGVRCVDCHYAPGERFTVKAKFKGLSQVASYFSGRYGTGRPRAHVSDESCLRSGCHGDQSHFTRILPIGEPRMEQRVVGGRMTEVQRNPSVFFVHQKHLDTAGREAELDRDVAAVSERLRSAAGKDGFAQIESAAGSVGPAESRDVAMKRITAQLQLTEAATQDAFELMRLMHRRVRVDQLAGLSCSACHTFNASMKSHFAADRQVCFTCHFANEEFNRNTGECLRCHEPPRRNVSVHADSRSGGQSVVMDHEDIVRRGVDCASCHLDVVRGEARVSERECAHCHDQSKFMTEFAARTTDTVRMYHKVHVANQRAHCFDCHHAVQHGLLDPAAPLAHSGGFLEPVLNNCQHCHPNHHAEQVELLTGTGGAEVMNAIPNAMIGSRLNCRACHTQAGEGDKGDAVVRATQQSCAACHGPEYIQLFDSWKHEIRTYLEEAEQRLAKVSSSVDQAKAGGAALPDRVAELLAAARHNIGLVHAGGGLHNRAYALQLLDTASQQLADVERLLAPPQ